MAHRVGGREGRGRAERGAWVSAAWLADHLDDPAVRVLEIDRDATLAYEAGHIPGAVNLYFTELLQEDGTFKDAEAMRRMVQARGLGRDTDVIVYCRLSHRATLAYFALTQLLGHRRVRCYDGSWTEWGSVVGIPIER